MRAVAWLLVLAACTHAPATATSSYFAASSPDAWSGGVRVLPLHTPNGDFHVWTKRVGNNPRIKVLLLTGGPGASHEIWEALDSYFPAAGIEYFYYDQLGTGFSDRPDDDSLWDIPRYVDEVEQVRTALGLDRDNFYVFGWSWGGVLAMEYALKYQQHLKGLIISDMVASIPAYNDYAKNVLEPAMDQKVLAEIKQLEADNKFDDPRYEQLLFENFYTQHILRKPIAEWPWTVQRAFETLNKQMYRLMQGPSEMGASGRLEHWDRFADLHTISVPTLVIGGKYDTMDPAYLDKMAHEMPHARHVTCPNGSHMSLYDDQLVYTSSVIQFIDDVDQGRL